MIYFGYSVGFTFVIEYDLFRSKSMIYFGYSVRFILVIEYDLFWL